MSRHKQLIISRNLNQKMIFGFINLTGDSKMRLRITRNEFLKDEFPNISSLSDRIQKQINHKLKPELSKLIDISRD